MHALSSLVVLGYYAGAILKRSVESYIAKETPIAWERLLCNIGPKGCAAEGATPGVVIASPTKADPDYWFFWTRDASLVFTEIVDSLAHNYSATLQTTIQDFVISQAKLQGVSNPSGSFADGTGLGEPKFKVDLTPFTDGWGRPQRDGPPLRAIALTRYAKWLVTNGYASTAKEVVWPVIKNDLAYTAQYWGESGYDLWEEVLGNSFFTVAASHRALVEGAGLAAQLGTECRACIAAAPHVLCYQQTFWKVTYVNSNRSTMASPKAKLLPSAAMPKIYQNGNPWYLNTFAAAEQLYDAIYVWEKEKSVTVTDRSLPFFKDLLPNLSAGIYKDSDPTFKSIIDAVFAYADGFMAICEKHTPADGSLNEQFDRNTGSPTSVSHLTWSYAAFLTAAGVAMSAAEYKSDDPLWSITVPMKEGVEVLYKYVVVNGDGSVRWESDPNRKFTVSSAKAKGKKEGKRAEEKKGEEKKAGSVNPWILGLFRPVIKTDWGLVKLLVDLIKVVFQVDLHFFRAYHQQPHRPPIPTPPNAHNAGWLFTSPELIAERAANISDPVESDESDVDEDDTLLDHAPNWGNGEEADRRQGLRKSSSDEGDKGRPWKFNPREECKLVLVVRTDLGMTKGKIAAQASHATLACYKSLLRAAQAAPQSTEAKLLRQWERNGQAKIAVQVKSEDELLELMGKARSLGVTAEVIADAGRTQIASGSRTVLGVGPAPKSVVDMITGGLKLL
ncbi:hypothetical protein N0V88_000227 [Collariella sp. IMI 366227]|nr:hypothetical protein N0V88_000227 [Collariella sp. IMI 366227]